MTNRLSGRVLVAALAVLLVIAGVLTLQASRDGTGTMLVLKNSLALPLKYRAWLRRPMRTTYEYTSSCPIEASNTLIRPAIVLFLLAVTVGWNRSKR